MSIQIMVLTLDGYKDWNVTNTEYIEVDAFNKQEIINTYFDGELEIDDINQPNPYTITCMGEESGQVFIDLN